MPGPALVAERHEERGRVRNSAPSAVTLKLADQFSEMGNVPPSHENSCHRVKNVHNPDRGTHKPASRRLYTQRFAEGLPVSFSPGESAAAAKEQRPDDQWNDEEDHGSKLETEDTFDDQGATTAGSNGDSDSEGLESDWDIDPEARSILDDIRSRRCEPRPGRKRVNRGPRSAEYQSMEKLLGLIARDVSKAEMNASKKALKAKDSEWSKLWDQKVWDASLV